MTTETNREQDTPPPALQSMAADWLYQQAELDPDFAALLDNRPCAPCAALEQEPPFGSPSPPRRVCRHPITDEWVNALANEYEAAISDRQGEWVETLIAGRPYDTPLVEWEHRELVDIDDAKEIAANQGHRYG